MKTLVKVSMVLMMSLMMNACLSEGAGDAAGGTKIGGDGDQPSVGQPGTASAKVTAISSNVVSNFGGQIVLTVDDISKGVASVEAVDGPLAFSVSGSQITVTFPEDDVNVNLNRTLTVKDNDGHTYGFDVSNQVLIKSGAIITSNVVLNANLSYQEYTAVHEASQKILRYDVSTYVWIDANGNATPITFQKDPATPNEGLNGIVRLGGDYLYAMVTEDVNVMPGVPSFRRYNLDGTLDPSFRINDKLAYLGEDSTHIYLYRAGVSEFALVRYSKANAMLDAGFTAPAVTESFGGHSYTFYHSRANIRFHNNRVYVQVPICISTGPQATCGVQVTAPYLIVYEKSNGARAMTTDALRFGMFQTNYEVRVNGSFRYAYQFGLQVDNGGVFQFGQGAGQILRNNLSDLALTNSFIPVINNADAMSNSNWKDLDYKFSAPPVNTGFLLSNLPIFHYQIAPTQPKIGWAAKSGEYNVVDVVRLDSGNRLIVTVENGDNAAPTDKLVCATILADNGVPIRGMRETRFCGSMTWDNVSSGTTAPKFHLIRNEKGETHKRIGNVYSFLLQTDKVWAVSFEISE